MRIGFMKTRDLTEIQKKHLICGCNCPEMIRSAVNILEELLEEYKSKDE